MTRRGRTGKTRLKLARRVYGRAIAAAGVFATTATMAQTPPQVSTPLTYGLYGQPGMIDTPTARMMPDGELSGSFAAFGPLQRGSLSFQIAPRLTGSFRYGALVDFFGDSTLYDRSFDLRFLALKEGRYRPAVTIGLQDFMGTGIYSSEYIVATKSVLDTLEITGGIGWGRLGGVNTLGSTGTRATGTIAQGGVPNIDRWFSGDYAAFGGIAYSPTDALTFKAEISSDAYEEEEARDIFDREGQINLGVDYRLNDNVQLSAYSLYGTAFGAMATVYFNPRTLGVEGGIAPGPLPVAVRAPGTADDLGWTADNTTSGQAAARLRELAAADGLRVEAVTLEPTRAVVRMVNDRYHVTSQAIGRMARAMTQALPASVEVFEIIPVVDGVPASSVVVARSDLERLEHRSADAMLERTQFVDAYARAPEPDAGIYPRLSYSVAPFLDLSVFDPESPLRYDLGVRAQAAYRVLPNVEVAGSIKGKILGNIGGRNPEQSGLPRVRTDASFFSSEGNPAVEYLTAAHYGRLGRDLYSRVTFGYLETMYAGASA